MEKFTGHSLLSAAQMIAVKGSAVSGTLLELQGALADLQLRGGQELMAQVRAPAGGGRLWLSINGRLLLASSDAQPEPGQQLRLRVVPGPPGTRGPRLQILSVSRNPLPADPLPGLSRSHNTAAAVDPGPQTGRSDSPGPIVSERPDATNPPQAAQLRDTLQRAIRASLPYQRGLDSLLGALRGISTQPDPALPPSLLRGIRDFLAQIPRPQDLVDPRLLRRQVIRAGPGAMAERGAVTARPPLAGLGFRQLATLESQAVAALSAARQPLALPPAGAETPPLPTLGVAAGSAARSTPEPADRTPPRLGDLFQHLFGALHRLKLVQLGSMLETVQGSGQPLAVEIPVRSDTGDHVLALRLEAEGHRRSDRTRPPCRIRLSLTLPGAGPLHGVISLTGSQVAVRLWAESPQLAGRLRQALPELAERLRRAGLQPQALSCHQGLPPDPPERRNMPLLDTRA